MREAIAAAAGRLAGVGDTPRLDAELLMAHALGIAREEMLLRRLGEPAPSGFEPLVERRGTYEPVAYITGRRAFWTIELEVGPGALIPRPDSETLIEAAVEHFDKSGPASVLDLGTGPGTLLLAALDQWPDARGIGIDRSAQALALAASNAGRLGLAARAEFRCGDWAEGLDERFELVLCNPPYVEDAAALAPDVLEWEPHEALFAGPDGLDAYRRLAPQIGNQLASDGIACVEIGATQEAAVRALFEAQDLAVRTRNDLARRPRCLILSA